MSHDHRTSVVNGPALGRRVRRRAAYPQRPPSMEGAPETRALASLSVDEVGGLSWPDHFERMRDMLQRAVLSIEFPRDARCTYIESTSGRYKERNLDQCTPRAAPTGVSQGEDLFSCATLTTLEEEQMRREGVSDRVLPGVGM